jgi:hypothetical protein
MVAMGEPVLPASSVAEPGGNVVTVSMGSGTSGAPVDDRDDGGLSPSASTEGRVFEQPIASATNVAAPHAER